MVKQAELLEETRASTQAAQIRRIIGVTSDKGGNGKSTVSRLIADLVIQRNIPTLAFDCDRRNAQLYRFYDRAFSTAFDSKTGVTRMDLSRKGGSDQLINSLDSDPSRLILIDFPAGGGELFEKLEQDTKLFELLEEIGYRMALVSVMSRIKDSIMSLKTLLEFCGDRADHVVIKNGFFGEPQKFTRFESSKTKDQLLQKGGVIVNFPDLHDDTYDLLDERNMTFSEALKPEGGLLLADRRRVKVFMDEAEAELLKAGPLLGLA